MNSSDESKIHYESLSKYFKYLVTISMGAIAIVAGCALYFTYNNLSDLRSEFKETLGEAKSGLQKVENHASEVLSETEKRVNDKVNIIEENAQSIAIDEAKKRVEKAFENDNVQRLVQETAKRILVDTLKNITEGYMRYVPELILATDKIRFGLREGLNYLDSLVKYSNERDIKELALYLYNGKARDYDLYVKENYKEFKSIDPYVNINPEYIKAMDTTRIIDTLVSIINQDQDLNKVAVATQLLRLYTKEEFAMFDFGAVKNWYALKRR